MYLGEVQVSKGIIANLNTTKGSGWFNDIIVTARLEGSEVYAREVVFAYRGQISFSEVTENPEIKKAIKKATSYLKKDLKRLSKLLTKAGIK